MMKLYVDHYLSHVASLGSPGVDEVRWLKPVRPGDAISILITISETKRSRSKRGETGTFFFFVTVCWLPDRPLL